MLEDTSFSALTPYSGDEGERGPLGTACQTVDETVVRRAFQGIRALFTKSGMRRSSWKILLMSLQVSDIRDAYYLNRAPPGLVGDAGFRTPQFPVPPPQHKCDP